MCACTGIGLGVLHILECMAVSGSSNAARSWLTGGFRTEISQRIRYQIRPEPQDFGELPPTCCALLFLFLSVVVLVLVSGLVLAQVLVSSSSSSSILWSMTMMMEAVAGHPCVSPENNGTPPAS